MVIGALADGRKQLLAVHDGFRESELSWTELLEDLKRRGLELPPKLAVGDGGLGFWAARRKVYPATREQRCWLRKTTNPIESTFATVCLRQRGAKGRGSREASLTMVVHVGPPSGGPPARTQRLGADCPRLGRKEVQGGRTDRTTRRLTRPVHNI